VAMTSFQTPQLSFKYHNNSARTSSLDFLDRSLSFESRSQYDLLLTELPAGSQVRNTFTWTWNHLSSPVVLAFMAGNGKTDHIHSLVHVSRKAGLELKTRHDLLAFYRRFRIDESNVLEDLVGSGTKNAQSSH
jgi:hypothetical protein